MCYITALIKLTENDFQINDGHLKSNIMHRMNNIIDQNSNYLFYAQSKFPKVDNNLEIVFWLFH